LESFNVLLLFLWCPAFHQQVKFLLVIINIMINNMYLRSYKHQAAGTGFWIQHTARKRLQWRLRYSASKQPRFTWVPQWLLRLVCLFPG